MNAAPGTESIGAAMVGHGEPADMEEMNKRLNTSIYDYFIKNGKVDLAEMMVKGKIDMNLDPGNKIKVNTEGMNLELTDEATKRLQALPKPSMPFENSNESFLAEWWTVFWEMFAASRRKSTSMASQYLNHMQARDFRNRQQKLYQSGYNPALQMQNGMQNGIQNNMNPQNLQRLALVNNHRSMPANLTNQNNRSMQVQQLQQQQQQMNQTNMQRDGSEQHPSSPMSGDNAPSPKRPRVDGASFNGQQIGRQPMAGMPATNGNGAAPALTQSGMNPHMQHMPPGTPGKLAQQQYAQQMAAVHNKMQGPPPNGSGIHDTSMMNVGAENLGATLDFYAAPDGQASGRNGMTDGAGGQAGGQNALHDYQVQLILLEQQNKRRLIQAKNEQHETTRDPAMMTGALAPMGMGGFAQGMSPQGSRTGQSPNPDQMKRGTPKVGGNSPLPDGTMVGRNSPGPMNFESAQFAGNMGNPMYAQMGIKPDGMVVGPGMRPPSSVPNAFMQNAQMNSQQIEMLRRNGALSNGLIAGQMQPQMGAQPQQPQDTPQPRNAMPPPQAPPATGNGRTQPSSPAQPAAPPTPQQANKANPKKKEAKEPKKKAPKKAAATTTGATPSEEQPPTPTPQTPITPVHPKSFTQNASAQPAPGQNPGQPENAAMQAPANGGQTDNNASAPFGSMDASTGLGFDNSMDFSNDVLDGFDFSAFLNADGPESTNFEFDPNGPFQLGEGLETSAGDP